MMSAKRVFLIAWIIFLMIGTSCDFQIDLNAPRKGFFLLKINAPKYIHIDQVVDLYMSSETTDFSGYDFNWSASGGVITGTGPSVQLTAPGYADTISVVVSISQGDQIVGLDAISIVVYRTLIMFKADDMICDNTGHIPQNWIRFIDHMKSMKVKTCVGIIGNSLEANNPLYFSQLAALHFSGFIELWNHGYDHLVNIPNEKGEATWEFYNTSYEHQKDHLLRTQDLARGKLGVSLKAFSSPGNKYDENTVRAVSEADEIRVWVFGLESSNKMVLGRDALVEFPVHNPDYLQFVQNWNPEKEYQVLQIHPMQWNEIQFGEFKKILDYLIQSGVTFLTFSDFYTLHT